MYLINWQINIVSLFKKVYIFTIKKYAFLRINIKNKNI